MPEQCLRPSNIVLAAGTLFDGAGTMFKAVEHCLKSQGKLGRMATLLRRLRGPDLAVDLGSATTRVASASSGRTLKAPSTVGRTRALRGGVVVEPDCAVEVLRPLFARIRRF